MAHGIGTDRPVSPLDREEIAKIEVGHTAISPALARVMVGVFLLAITLLPAIEIMAGGLPAPQPGGSGVAGGSPDGEAGPPGVSGGAPRHDAGVVAWWRAVVAANRGLLASLTAFETALEDQSAIGRALRPPTQVALSALLGAGNERVYLGDGEWLFYRPDVEYVTGRGFLDPGQHERRMAAASEYETPPQPDPRPAIRAFARALAARGITLILMPTPVKPTVHPGPLAGDGVRPPLHNPSYDRFVEELRREGLLVFDPAEVFAATTGADRDYLATDTHWRPETMQRVAQALAGFVREHASLPAAPAAGYTAERREARQMGDTAAMLDLPDGQTLYPPERVLLRYIVDPDGNPWRSRRDADVLLLGDSFTNIYSLASMGWGEAAGLAEQLSFVLQRPVDRIVQNDQGASATRVFLARDPMRLEGKRVVIWQFAARELAFGDWRLVELP